MTETPALDVLLGKHDGLLLDLDGTPNECPGCPFAGRSEDFNPADPGEGHYPCALLGKVVWGEGPLCERADWQARARAELAPDVPEPEWVEECPVCADLGHHLGFGGSWVENQMGIDVASAKPPVTISPARRVCECRAGHRFECEVRIEPGKPALYKLGGRVL